MDHILGGVQTYVNVLNFIVKIPGVWLTEGVKRKNKLRDFVIQSNLDNSKCQGSQEFLRIIGSSNFRNRQFSDMFGYFYLMSLYDDYCNLISALWVSNGNICQSIKENALPEGCSHRLLRLTCLRKQEEKKRKHELTFLFTAINSYENEVNVKYRTI